MYHNGHTIHHHHITTTTTTTAMIVGQLLAALTFVRSPIRLADFATSSPILLHSFTPRPNSPDTHASCPVSRKEESQKFEKFD